MDNAQKRHNSGMERESIIDSIIYQYVAKFS